MAGRAPHYQLTETHGDLPKGSYIRPIELKWVPKCTIEALGNSAKFIDETRDVVCYTRIGMVIIPRTKIEEV